MDTLDLSNYNHEEGEITINGIRFVVTAFFDKTETKKLQIIGINFEGQKIYIPVDLDDEIHLELESTKEELEILLQEAIEDEDFELAAQIRDELKNL